MATFIFVTIASSSPVPTTNSVQQSKALVKFSKNWNIEAAYNNMTSAVENVLSGGDFPQLRRACIHKIKSLKSNLPHKLIPQILRTSSMNGLLDMLAQSEYWNWFDTRLLEALTYASGSPEAIELLEHFKSTFYPRKVSEFIPYQLVRPFKDFTSLKDKFDKDPSEVTVYELLQHRYKIETEVLDTDEGELVLSCIKTGCVELTWQIPRELVYRAYTSMKRKHDELSSLAVKSLVCEEADRVAGLPFLWRGQEVGEVGPIEPLPVHVRQEPYSLPQGFHWVALSFNDCEEVVKFLKKGTNRIIDSTAISFIMSHPNIIDEWQFGIRATNGKLVGVVLANPACISIGGVPVTCMKQILIYHPKYKDKRLRYMLIKELTRRVNLYNINHLILSIEGSSILKPLSNVRVWKYIYNYPTSNQLPSSPRTPGWRRMTLEDVPSALALINKWSSQFEIRQVFNSEEEFVHYYLCPTIPNFSYTYVVENDVNITDLVSFRLVSKNMQIQFVTTTVASTQSPLKQLIIDALVCAKELDATEMIIHNWNIKPDVLSSLSFHYKDDFSMRFSIYNYKYYETSEARAWYYY